MNEVTRPAGTMVDGLMRLIADPNVGTDKLELLIRLQTQALEARAKEDFALAFSELSAELPQLEREGTVELSREGKRMGSYRYLKLEDLDKVVRPILSKHGFGITYSTRVADDGTVILKGELLHSGGHSKTSEFPVLSDRGPGRNDLQARGSGLSYARRYVCESLLNLVRKDVDDDAITALDMKIGPKQVEQLAGLIKAAKRTPEKFLSLLVTGVDRLEDVPQREFPRLLNACNQMISANAKKGQK